jgi:hypothetical protein
MSPKLYSKVKGLETVNVTKPNPWSAACAIGALTNNSGTQITLKTPWIWMRSFPNEKTKDQRK